MMQNLQLYRGKKGMDTMFDHNEAWHLVSSVRRAAKSWGEGVNAATPNLPGDPRTLETNRSRQSYCFQALVDRSPQV